MNEVTKFTILGERCSGTNFLENAISENFNLDVTWEYGWKHFFGFNDFANSDNTLFIGIVRDPIDWLDSFYKQPHHLHTDKIDNLSNFLFEEHYGFSKENNQEMLEDRNYLTKERYKNIFELRSLKNDYLIYIMPGKVKNYILIRYEDLKNNYEGTLNKIQYKFNLELKNNKFKPITFYKSEKNTKYVPRKLSLSVKNILLIHQNLNTKQERQLGYLSWQKYWCILIDKIKQEISRDF